MKKLTQSLPVSGAAATLTLALAVGALPVAPALAMDAPSAMTTATASAWVATWQASPQPVWGLDFLFPTNLPAVLNDQTVRQVARISLGGPRLRIVLSNAYGSEPINMGKATVAQAMKGDAVAGVV